jgi:hypothetical protein
MPASKPNDYPGAPRWVKLLGVIALALLVVFAAVHITGRGFHHGGEAHAPEHR